MKDFLSPETVEKYGPKDENTPAVEEGASGGDQEVAVAGEGDEPKGDAEGTVASANQDGDGTVASSNQEETS